MANVGTGLIAGSPQPLLLDITGDTNLSVNVRQGFLTFSAGAPFAAQNPIVGHGQRTAGTFTHTQVNQRAGHVVSDHLSVWYDNTILHPQTVSTGTIVSDYTFDLLIWNSGRIQRTFTVTRTGWDGIDDAIPGSLVLGPLCWRAYPVTVTMAGPAAVAASMSFTDALNQTATATISGLRGMVWGFQPNVGMKESWEWKTELQSAWDYSEQRLALRVVPRQTRACTYTLHSSESTHADMMLYDMSQYQYTLPCFEQAVTAQAISSGAEAIPCDISYANWKVGSVGLLWESHRKAELFTVTQVGSESLRPATPISQAFDTPLVMPCFGATLEGGASRADRSTDTSDFEVTFRIVDPADWPIPDDTDVPQYEGHDIWEMPLYFSGGTLSREMSCPVVLLDNGLGVAKRFHAQPVASGAWQISTPCDNLQAILQVRGLLLRRQGCARPFWMSTRRHDFFPSGILRAGSDSLLIAGCATGGAFPSRSLRKRLRIELKDGRVFYRNIISLTKEDLYTDTLRLSEALDASNDIQPSDFSRVSFMTLVRLASDKVEWTWEKTFRTTVTFSVQEVLL